MRPFQQAQDSAQLSPPQINITIRAPNVTERKKNKRLQS